MARKKDLKNDDVTSFPNYFYDFDFPWKNAIATTILNA